LKNAGFYAQNRYAAKALPFLLCNWNWQNTNRTLWRNFQQRFDMADMALQMPETLPENGTF
jgi:hypothetical protein